MLRWFGGPHRDGYPGVASCATGANRVTVQTWFRGTEVASLVAADLDMSDADARFAVRAGHQRSRTSRALSIAKARPCVALGRHGLTGARRRPPCSCRGRQGLRGTAERRRLRRRARCARRGRSCPAPSPRAVGFSRRAAGLPADAGDSFPRRAARTRLSRLVGLRPAEGCRSGRTGALGKRVYGKPYLGFESLSLRHRVVLRRRVAPAAETSPE
jgi:hypothetical protein